jgi:DNA-binding SARP family transcriptional activator
MLGPLQVRADGSLLNLGGKWTRLLARLLIDANRPVASDQLLEDLFAGRATTSLMNSISRLRSLLGANVIFATPPGYELRVDWARTDVHRFEQLAAAGREQLAGGDPAGATETLRLALGLWRGQPFGDLGREVWARPEVARLEELKLNTIEDQIDAGLALGNPEILPMLERLAVHYPRRGRLRGQLILALRNAGRPVEAVAVLGEAVRFFSDDPAVGGGPLRNELQALMSYVPVPDWMTAGLVTNVDEDTELRSLGRLAGEASAIADMDEDIEYGEASVIADLDDDTEVDSFMSSRFAFAEPRPQAHPAEATGRLFDDWAFRLGRGEWPDPNHYLDQAGDHADELRDLMDIYVRALPRPTPAQDDIERARAWLTAVCQS